MLAHKTDVPVWRITSTLQQGWALAIGGDAEGVTQIRQCIDLMRAAMGGIIIAFNATLADVLLHHGQAEEALGVVNESLAEGEKKNDHHHVEAELHRLKGECLMLLSRYDEAATCFHQSLEVSRRQGAKSLELRAAMSMTQLVERQGKPVGS